MSKPIIAVDIDDVLAAEAEFIVAYSNKHWGHKLLLNDFQEDWGYMWQADTEEVERRAKELHYPGIVSTYRLLEWSREVLSELATKYRLIVVTSRRVTVKEETLCWLKENFGDIFGNVIFTGFYDSLAENRHYLTKGEILRNEGVRYLIDDQPKHCFAAAETGMFSVLFGDYGVSKDLELPSNVTRCKDWKQVAEYFNAIKP